MDLEITNLTTTKIDKGHLEKVVKKTLEILGHKKEDITISLVLVGAGRIRQLNKKWRGRNKVTDVLAFSGQEKKGASKFIIPKHFQEFLGEIFICLAQVRKQAKKIGHSFKKELTLVLVHGILHLVEYDDEGTDKERTEMRKIEREILVKILK